MNAVGKVLHVALACLLATGALAEPAGRFPWPGGARAALSLSFDDARASQVDVGLAVLEAHGVKATFFVVPDAVERRLAGWRKAVAAGHEIGNHSLTHPCSGNFPWARQKALEDYTVDRMRRELVDANARVKELLGVTPETFAYPCGQSFVGRGRETRSYVPVVAELFLAGRGWLDEAPNDPRFGDPAQVLAIEMDGKDFPQILPALEQARETGGWVVLAGHEIGPSGRQTTRLGLLEKLIPYARDPANGLWLGTVGAVARHIGQVQLKGDSR
ncbi:MAG TPA: polysaccharide deacetylase family protein [Vicinamibacteria bacterium]|nr:polysaccharide deacetylase family protein [Vicinamibacteria bacterium]